MILVLTAGFGDGHNTAAFSTAEALRQLYPGEDIQAIDLVSEVQPRIATLLKNLYQQAITHFPSGWRMVYHMLEKSDVDPQDSAWLAPLVRGLKEKIEALQPRLIISTYPLYAALLDALRKQGEPVPRLVTIITDSISVHRIWLMQPSDLYCVADAETKEVVEKLGVPREKIRITGFPVSLQFTETLPPEATRPGVQRILYLPSTTARHVAATLASLKPLLRKDVQLTIPVGKHSSRLYHVLRKFTDAMPDAPVEIIGWTTRIPELLRTHDVVICKAGGAILHEVLAARIPAVIDYVVPGQEEGNAEMLLSRNCAYRAFTAKETGECVAKILDNNGKIGRQMRTNMLAISVPDAAIRTAQAALA
ncbi:processive 1,2-diacylglycerol beta-glucosyltransferase [Prosthecobacter fusiformis]|uniref:Processive 1,2-diacylglycerol beta-glucosyltransferase n=1 Tax=Prosthecobacter fusiformis TaxID=48464 RepID=A0A4R7RJV6_9BACT|nr:glycosyltransferase [Prosthecobacter fusiformis]TDU64319.1 processive 1,2-diacylglycerol beta-glucosyltransferase [Prosthecobacter fusiformis]